MKDTKPATRTGRRHRLAAGATLLAAMGLLISGCADVNGSADDAQAVNGAATSRSEGSASAVGDTRTAPAKVGAKAAVNDSYKLTSGNITVPNAGHSDWISASCGDDYYVRPAPPPALQPTNGLGPAVQLGGDDKWVSMSGFRVDSGNRIGNRGSWAPFSGFSIRLYNESAIHKHTVTFSWWCDAVTPWVRGDTAQVSKKKVAIDPPDPINPDCYFCGYGMNALTNVATGEVLNNSGGNNTEGNRIITWPSTQQGSGWAPNQRWAYQQGGFLDGMPTYGIYAGVRINTADIVEDQNTHLVTLHMASKSTSGGNWYYESLVAGPVPGAVMLINTDSERCLTAGPNQGDQVTTLPCNTYDQSQWWTETKA